LATATFVVVSSMIGTGVLTTSGFTVYFVGSNQLMLALWVVGGVLALCELSAALPRSGGDYVFLSEAYGPMAAFLSGWVSFLIGFGGPIAASASAAAKYLLAPMRLGEALLGRRPGDFLDAERQLGLCTPPAPARSSAAVPDAGLSGRAGRLPRRDRPFDRSRLLRAAGHLVDLAIEHRGRRARLLRAVRRRPAPLHRHMN